VPSLSQATTRTTEGCGQSDHREQRGHRASAWRCSGLKEPYGGDGETRMATPGGKTRLQRGQRGRQHSAGYPSPGCSGQSDIVGRRAPRRPGNNEFGGTRFRRNAQVAASGPSRSSERCHANQKSVSRSPIRADQTPAPSQQHNRRHRAFDPRKYLATSRSVANRTTNSASNYFFIGRENTHQRGLAKQIDLKGYDVTLQSKPAACRSILAISNGSCCHSSLKQRHWRTWRQFV
jgi:hypothetical protein